MPDICVVHLVRRKNGIEPFQSFLASYIKNSSGIDHELLIVYKGFSRKTDIDSYEKLLKDVPHSFLEINDFGRDLRAYFIAAQKCSSKYFCFLNSFSIILDKDWLLKLYQNINQPGVGLVGATGSWGSIAHSLEKKPKTISYKDQLKRAFFKYPKRIFIERYLLIFPNYHIRTNGFMVAREIMLKIHRGFLFTKIQAYLLESGRWSITRQIESMNLRVIVVGRDGMGYEKHQWNISNTFWQGTQKNLLISDNQTRRYDRENLDWRQKWEFFAWGSNAKEFLDQ